MLPNYDILIPALEAALVQADAVVSETLKRASTPLATAVEDHARESGRYAHRNRPAPMARSFADQAVAAITAAVAHYDAVQAELTLAQKARAEARRETARVGSLTPRNAMAESGAEACC